VHILSAFLRNFLSHFYENSYVAFFLVTTAFAKQQLSTMPAHARLNHAIFNNNNSIIVDRPYLLDFKLFKVTANDWNATVCFGNDKTATDQFKNDKNATVYFLCSIALFYVYSIILPQMSRIPPKLS